MRKLFVLLAVGMLAVGLLTGTGSAAGASPHAKAACAHVGGPASSVGRFGGVVHAQSIARIGCSDGPPNGLPPLLWHGGPMMGTTSTGPIVVTPIFWSPLGHPMSSSYKNIIASYLTGVAADSGSHTNVFSTLTEYSGSNGFINYNVQVGPVVNDRGALPASGCTVASNDTSGIYADNSGYDACLDDDQVIAETDRIANALGLPRDLAHMYVLFLPKHVESCFYAGSTETSSNFCTINHQPSAAYCAYHSMAPDSMVYGNLAYPIYASPVGFTCSSDAVYPKVQAPNGNKDADTEVSPTSHEIMEAVTDPDVSTGWYDIAGFENGDECAYIFGSVQGNFGKFYNQVISGRHYLTQEEFSNLDFATTGLGCLPFE